MKTRKHLILIFVLTVINATFIKGQQINIGQTQIDTTSVVTNLDTPWELVYGPDDKLWITERPGRVSYFDVTTGVHNHVLTIDDVYEESESGLLGLALHPDFEDSAFVFLVYNFYDNGIKEKIVRYTLENDQLTDPFVLLDFLWGARNHNGSRLVIDENYKLFVTTGDVTNSSLSQNTKKLNGKIMRMNLDGSIPDDNPIEDSYIWSWGHRNPQGLVIAPNGIMYSSEHGPNNDDELNIIEKGRNYGWPDVQGFCDGNSEQIFCEEHNVREPIAAWTPTLAVSGIDYYHSDSIPDWKHSILMTSLKASELTSISLSEDGLTAESSSTWFKNTFGRLRDVCTVPDGSVYIAVSNRDGRGSPLSYDDRIVHVKRHASNPPTSFQNKEKNTEKIVIYPNPLSSVSSITLPDEWTNSIYRIYSGTGRLVRTGTFTDNTNRIYKSELSPGIYHMSIIKEKFHARVKLVITD